MDENPSLRHFLWFILLADREVGTAGRGTT